MKRKSFHESQNMILEQGKTDMFQQIIVSAVKKKNVKLVEHLLNGTQDKLICSPHIQNPVIVAIETKNYQLFDKMLASFEIDYLHILPYAFESGKGYFAEMIIKQCFLKSENDVLKAMEIFKKYQSKGNLYDFEHRHITEICCLNYEKCFEQLKPLKKIDVCLRIAIIFQRLNFVMEMIEMNANLVKRHYIFTFRFPYLPIIVYFYHFFLKYFDCHCDRCKVFTLESNLIRCLESNAIEIYNYFVTLIPSTLLCLETIRYGILFQRYEMLGILFKTHINIESVHFCMKMACQHNLKNVDFISLHITSFFGKFTTIEQQDIFLLSLHSDIYKLLYEQHNINLNTKNKKTQKTYLYYAYHQGLIHVTKWLITNGCQMTQAEIDRCCSHNLTRNVYVQDKKDVLEGFIQHHVYHPDICNIIMKF